MGYIAHEMVRAVVAVLLSIGYASASGQVLKLDAPNVVEISSELITSGQPTARALAELKSQGIGGLFTSLPPPSPTQFPTNEQSSNAKA